MQYMYYRSFIRSNLFKVRSSFLHDVDNKVIGWEDEIYSWRWTGEGLRVFDGDEVDSNAEVPFETWKGVPGLLPTDTIIFLGTEISGFDPSVGWERVRDIVFDRLHKTLPIIVSESDKRNEDRFRWYNRACAPDSIYDD